MNYGVILAGGSGVRIKSVAIPKQFIEIGGRPMLLLTVEKFLLCGQIGTIVVTAPPAWLEHTRDLLDEKRFAGLDVCPGGGSRQESLYNALKHIEARYQPSDEDIAVSHDAVRPFVSLRILRENVEACLKYGAVDTVIPASDTIVVSKDGQSVFQIPDRASMYQGQTPQSFRIRQFLRIYESLSPDYIAAMTDAARIMQEHGVTVRLVPGDPSNIKITTDYDLGLVNYILSGPGREGG
jgi:2-C-methyl-D-erythritol 4-phosphate cytidylyltransferase